MKKKMLIISYTYPPANAPAAWRPYYFAKYLDKNKYDITVLTCSNQDSSLGFDDTFDNTLERVKIIGIKTLGVKKTESVKKQIKKQSVAGYFKSKILSFLLLFVFPDKGIFWLPFVIKYINKNQKDLKFDIIFTTSPLFTNHLVALKLLKINKNAKYISDFRDFHYLENFQKKKGIKSLLHKKVEHIVIQKSDNVLFISDAMKKIYGNYYKSFKKKFHTIYNGFDFDSNDKNKIGVLKKDKLSIFYAGSFYKGVRSPFPLFEILERMVEKKIISIDALEINIAGNLEIELIEKLKKYNVFQSVNLLGKIPRNEVLKKYKQSHLLWLIVGNTIEHYAGLPIKFYEYLASKRPVINFAPDISEPTKVINKHNLGWNFNTKPFDIDKATKNFEEIIIKFHSGELNYPLQSENIKTFSRKEQTKLLEEIIEK